VYDEVMVLIYLLASISNHATDEPSLRCHQQRPRYVLVPMSAPISNGFPRISQVCYMVADNYTAVGVQGDARVYGYIAM
jgi:hypothetical protein